jgi:hypothetical protein
MSLKNTGIRQTVYYFCKSKKKNSIARFPNGYKVIEGKNTGLPMLKKI